jgi:hypothetical protein
LVSNRLVSKVLAMVAQDRTVAKIFDSLLGGAFNTHWACLSKIRYVSEPSLRVTVTQATFRCSSCHPKCIATQAKTALFLTFPAEQFRV